MNPDNLAEAQKFYTEFRRLDELQLRVRTAPLRDKGIPLHVFPDRGPAAEVYLPTTAVVRLLHDLMGDVRMSLTRLGVDSYMLYPTDPPADAPAKAEAPA